MASNKNPIHYPCFKVVSTKGELLGYSGRGGLMGKRKLLEKDGVRFSMERIERKYFYTFGKIWSK